MKWPKLILTAVLIGAAVSAAAQNDPDISAHQCLRFSKEVTKTLEANYLLFLPQDYDAEGETKWPLLIFLHGAGERGTNLSLVAVHGPPKLVKTRRDFPFVLVSPQCPPGQRWQDDVVLGVLDEIASKHNVDTNRVYLTGLSMGGYGTWSLATKHPERFAAVAPICGGGETIDVLLSGRQKSAALKSAGVWAFHGGKDSVVAPAESERMVDLLQKVGCTDVKLTIYPEAGHDSWTEAYNNPDLYKWFLQHTRSNPQPPPSPTRE